MTYEGGAFGPPFLWGVDMHAVHIDGIFIPENRQRKEFKANELTELADSISRLGLIHPVVVRQEGGKNILVAGERRVKAIQYVWNFGQKVKCAGEEFDEGYIPCLLHEELDPLDAYEIELEENIRRVDLTWQEKSIATSQLYEMRRLQAEKKGAAAPTIADITEELHGTAEGNMYSSVRAQILVSKHLDDPDVAKATSAKDALKILKRKEEAAKSAELGRSVGATYSAAVHKLILGDCLMEMEQQIEPRSVDVILTDPPYGIDAHEFGDSGGKTGGAHFYDDSFDTWSKLMQEFCRAAYRVARDDAHAYVFCDIDNFVFLKSYMDGAGWKSFRTPLVWVNPTAMRTPWPESGPQRKYQICLYAIKGDKAVTRIYPDVFTYPSDENLGHQAQKPVAAYVDLLRRSTRPGDTVLDPFCGSGPIFPACHELKLKAIGIEQSEVAYGIAVKRLQGLK